MDLLTSGQVIQAGDINIKRHNTMYKIFKFKSTHKIVGPDEVKSEGSVLTNWPKFYCF